MLQYVLAGLALGSIYAIASAGLVITFVSAGVLNFAFGSMAYVVARFYYAVRMDREGKDHDVRRGRNRTRRVGTAAASGPCPR